MINLVQLNGRIGRRRWWMDHLIGLVATMFVAAIFMTVFRGKAHTFLVVLFFLWASVTSTVKRYHDRNKSGWWAALLLVPVLGSIWTLIECGFLPGTPGANQYGPARGKAPDPLTDIPEVTPQQPVEPQTKTYDRYSGPPRYASDLARG